MCKKSRLRPLHGNRRSLLFAASAFWGERERSTGGSACAKKPDGHKGRGCRAAGLFGQIHALTDENDRILAGRFGGDAFILFYKQADSLEEILRGVQTLLQVEGFPFEISCCAGIALLRSTDETFAEVFRRADLSVCQAKSEARACMVVYREIDEQ